MSRLVAHLGRVPPSSPLPLPSSPLPTFPQGTFGKQIDMFIQMS